MYLGIDLGTSGVKALLIDADQAVDRLGHRARSTSRARIPAGPSRIRPTGSPRPKRRSPS